MIYTRTSTQLKPGENGWATAKEKLMDMLFEMVRKEMESTVSGEQNIPQSGQQEKPSESPAKDKNTPDEVAAKLSGRKKNKRFVKLGKESKLSKKMIDELNTFVDYTPVERLSRNLRNMLLLYLTYEKDGLPNEFDDLMLDLLFLFRFLDTASDELRENGEEM